MRTIKASDIPELISSLSSNKSLLMTSRLAWTTIILNEDIKRLKSINSSAELDIYKLPTIYDVEKLRDVGNIPPKVYLTYDEEKSTFSLFNVTDDRTIFKNIEFDIVSPEEEKIDALLNTLKAYKTTPTSEIYFFYIEHIKVDLSSI